MIESISWINVDMLLPHPDNPRKELGDLTELVESIKRSGVMQNLTVVPASEDEDGYTEKYTVIIGHRRLAAAKEAGLRQVPCAIAHMDYPEQIATMLAENVQRSDLTLYEQAQGVQMMIDLGSSVADVSARTGLSESTVRRRIKLAQLPGEAFKASVERGGRLEDYARLDEIEDEAEREKLLGKIGTKDFEGAMQTAVYAQRTMKRKEKMLAELDAFARRVEVAPTNSRYASSYSVYSNSNVKVPEDAETVEYVYTESDGYVQLYRVLDEEQVSEQTAEVERLASLRRQLEERRNAMAELLATARGFMQNYVVGMSDAAAEKALPIVSADLMTRLYKDDIATWPEHKIADMLSMPKWDDTEEENEADTLRNLGYEVDQLSPERRVLLSWFALLPTVDKPYDWHGVYEKSEELEALYAVMEKIGYVPEPWERQLLDGTHELYAKEDKA